MLLWLTYYLYSIYLYFLFPIKVKYLIGFLVLVSFFSTLGPQSDGIAHAAHLGGAVVGFVYLKYWYLYYKLRGLSNKVLTKDRSNLKYSKKNDHDEDKIEYYRGKIDELLDKINKVGYLNLTEEEKHLLEEGSRYLREHDSENFN